MEVKSIPPQSEPWRAWRAVLVALTAMVPTIPAQAQFMVLGNEEKVWWDDAGKQLNQPPGKDTIGIYDIKMPAMPRLLATLHLENSIFGPPANIAIAPSGEIALVANSVTQVPTPPSLPTAHSVMETFPARARPAERCCRRSPPRMVQRRAGSHSASSSGSRRPSPSPRPRAPSMPPKTPAPETSG